MAQDPGAPLKTKQAVRYDRIRRDFLQAWWTVVIRFKENGFLGLPWLKFCLPKWGHGFNPCSRKIPHAAGQLSPCATTNEPVLSSLQATTTHT